MSEPNQGSTGPIEPSIRCVSVEATAVFRIFFISGMEHRRCVLDRDKRVAGTARGPVAYDEGWRLWTSLYFV